MSSRGDKVNTGGGGGVGFLGGLFLIFLWLKLNPGGRFTTPVADWSWGWVTAPLWAVPAIILAVLLAWGISTLIVKAFNR